nr:sigma factor [Streptomyces sp. SID13031]
MATGSAGPGSSPGPDPGPDHEVWERLRQGDQLALGELFDRYANDVHAFAFRRTASWNTAEDVVQTTFLSTWRRFQRNPPGPLTGTIAVTNGKHESLPPIAGSTPTFTVGNTQPPLPLLKDIDLGRVSPAEQTEGLSDCAVTGQPEVLWSRKVKGPDPADKSVVLLLKGPAGPDARFSKGVAVCVTTNLTAPVWDATWAKSPTRAQGVIMLAGNPFAAAKNDKYASVQNWGFYRVRPEIARVQSRMVWKGGSGPWTTGVVAGGFAYVDSRANEVMILTVDYKLQVRAFDKQGRPVPVKN